MLRPFSRYDELQAAVITGKYTDQALTDWSSRLLARQSTLLRLLLLDSPRLKHALTIVSIVSAIVETNDEMVKTLLREAHEMDNISDDNIGTNPANIANLTAFPTMNSPASASLENASTLPQNTQNTNTSFAYSLLTAPMHIPLHTSITPMASAPSARATSPSLSRALAHLRARARTVYTRLAEWCVEAVSSAFTAAVAYQGVSVNSPLVSTGSVTGSVTDARHPYLRVVERVVAAAARAGEQLCATRNAICGQISEIAGNLPDMWKDKEMSSAGVSQGEVGRVRSVNDGNMELQDVNASTMEDTHDSESSEHDTRVTHATVAAAAVLGGSRGQGHAMAHFEQYCTRKLSMDSDFSDIPENLIPGCAVLFASVDAYIRNQGVEDEQEIAGHILSLCARYTASADALQHALKTLSSATRTPLASVCETCCFDTLRDAVQEYLGKEYKSDWTNSAILGLEEWLGASAAPVLETLGHGHAAAVRERQDSWLAAQGALFGQRVDGIDNLDSITNVESLGGNWESMRDSMGYNVAWEECAEETMRVCGCDAGQSGERQKCYCAWFQELCSRVCQEYVEMRVPQMFDIMVDYPNSAPCLADLAFCITLNPENAYRLSEALLSQFARKLYQPSAPTSLILTQLINAAKVSLYIDPSATMLAELVTRTRNCLLERPDGLFHVASALRGMGPLPLSDLLDPRVVPQQRIVSAACSLERIAHR